MLGFAIPIENSKDFELRKKTVEKWRDEKITPIVLENQPRYGFKIVDTVSRYRTNNKLFRVLDPQGFELEISAANLFHIIETCTIIKGVIAEPMLWANKNYLISEKSEEYQQYLNPIKQEALVVGSWLKHKTGTLFYRYEGTFSYLSVDHVRDRKDRNHRNRYHRKPDYSDVTTDIKFIINRKNDKKAIVYTQWALDSNGTLKSTPSNIHIRKSNLKDLIPETEPKVVSYQLPLGEFLENVISSVGSGGYRTNFMLFDNVKGKDMKEITLEELVKLKNLYLSYSDSGYYGKITYSVEDIKK
jgi:hypothetical protein